MSAISILILILVISSGSVLACSISERKYGDIVPISCFALIFVELLLGIIFNLKVGLIVAMLLAAGCYVAALVITIKKKTIKSLVKNITSPGLIFFAIACALFFYINRGKYFSYWDEFSHWGDVVRAMVYLDDFGTNKASMCMFPSYPPAMSIFQYFIERVNSAFSDGKFNESLSYNAYHILLASFALPFVERVGLKSKISSVLLGLGYLLLPLMAYDCAYASIYIDPFIGLMAGVGFGIVLFFEDGIYKSLLLSSCLGILIISKDSGMLFAMTVLAAYLLTIIIGKKSKKHILYIAISIVGALLPKVLWKYELKKTSTWAIFSEKVDVKEFFGIVVGKIASDNYRANVWKIFLERFTGESVNWSRFGIPLSYMIVVIILFAIIIALSIIGIKKKSIDKKYIIVSNIMILATFTMFTIGVACTYMYKFSQYEAEILASFDRYINTGVLMILTYVFLLATRVLLEGDKRATFILKYAILLMLAILTVPRFQISNELTRFSAKKSLYGVEELRRLADSVNEITDGNNGVWLIAQENNGYYNLFFNSLIRPNRGGVNCSIGEAFYEGDDHSLIISCDEWEEELCVSYDYVVLYVLNDYFYDNFSSAFVDSNDIHEMCIYKLNKETKKLELVY